jgi:NDP-sugar pyrophosphorylase family protein
MQAIILAAGRGKRLGGLTEAVPKPMTLIGGKPMLSYIIDTLPAEIRDVIMVVGYHGEMIRDYFEENYEGKRISYLETPELKGTADALFEAKAFLKGRFLVLYGDDFHEAGDLERLIRHPLAMGVFEGVPNHGGYLYVEIDGAGNVAGFRKPSSEEILHGTRVVTGAFALDERIFKHNPVRIENGEYGLPQTILKFAERHPVAAVGMPSWRTITYPDDIRALELHLMYRG